MAEHNFEGIGTLRGVNMHFEGKGLITQKTDGRIVWQLTGDQITVSLDLDGVTSSELTVIDARGRKMKTTGLLATGLNSGNLAAQNAEGSLSGISNYSTRHTTRITPQKSFKYHLLNFMFTGNKWLNLGGKRGWNVLGAYGFSIDDWNCTLLHQRSTESNVRVARTTREARHTCDLRMTFRGEGEPEPPDELVADICTLLGFGMGHIVGWKTRKSYDSHRRLISETWRTPVIKPYSKLPVLAASGRLGIGSSELDHLIKPGLISMGLWNTRLGSEHDKDPLTQAIRAVSDARAEGPYLQVRTLAAIISLEILVSRYSEVSKTVNITAKRNFDKLASKLKPIISQHDFASVTDHTMSKFGKFPALLISEKIPELNRPSSKHQITRLANAVGLGINEADLKAFTQIRNSLTHQGRYLDAEKGLGSNWAQHRKVLEFVDRLLLGLVGYRGRFMPITKLSESQLVELYP